MNIVFVAIILIAFVTTAFRQIVWTPIGVDDIAPMQMLTTGMIDSAKASVTLALGLVGVMALFLGLMKIAEEGGLLKIIARLVRPLMTRLFPDVPAEHPAMGAMIMNISANVLGLGNAATPFGIRAMQELDKLNTQKGTATNAMCLFLAINTSSVTLLPTGVIALRASAGSADAAGIMPTTLFATLCSTIAAITAAKLYQRFSEAPAPPTIQANEHADGSTGDDPEFMNAGQGYPAWVGFVALLVVVSLIPLTLIYGSQISDWVVPGLMVGFILFGVVKKVPVYETFVEGAKEGFEVAVRIIPYLVAILVAVGMLRNSGALAVITQAIGSLTASFGLPGEAVPMALLRPLSGSGAYGVMASIIEDPAIGPDSYTGYLVSTLQGSTETTFYVLAVYFGAVQVRRVRHALAAGLTADLVGIIAAVIACSVVFSNLA